MGFLTDHPVILKPEYKDNAFALAVKRLLDKCNSHQGGGTWPINDFLLSLYNGAVWAPDLQLLCARIDQTDFEDVIFVMQGYAKRAIELHTYFVSGSKLFESIAPCVRTREPGGYCDDDVVLPLNEYLYAVIQHIGLCVSETRSMLMVKRAKAIGFFGQHASCDELRRRVRVSIDAAAIEERAAREAWPDVDNTGMDYQVKLYD